jgi:prevent-host-death family protein
MTMSRSRWNIATAKAELSRLVLEARDGPQIIESRGRPVAVVLSTEAYARLAEGQDLAGRWQSLLKLSEELREHGGVTLKIPRRRSRPDPLAHAKR